MLEKLNVSKSPGPDGLHPPRDVFLTASARAYQKHVLHGPETVSIFISAAVRQVAALLVPATICRRPVTLTFDLLTLKLVWESHVTWGTPVQSFVFLGLLVFELEPMAMYATSDGQTDGQTDGRRTPITALCPIGGGIIDQ